MHGRAVAVSVHYVFGCVTHGNILLGLILSGAGVMQNLLVWGAVLFAVLAGFAALLLALQVTRSRNNGHDGDLLAQLYVMVEREGSARANEVERQRLRNEEMERRLYARLDQIRVEFAEKLGDMATRQGREQADLRATHAEARAAQEAAMREMAQNSAKQLDAIRGAVNEQLHAAVERQMQTSFQRVIEQFSAMQKAMGEVTAMAAQIGDLKRLFSNVKTRGGWGEAQLGAILDDVLPPGSYVRNARLGEDGRESVEFAVRMPVRTSVPPVLAIDSKFPTESYERLLQAVEEGDADAERAARRNLEGSIRMEARKIASKYIRPPATVEFAVLYLPTDGLYAEVAHMPGLIDEIGRTSRVIVMGPSLIPALLRTIHLGYVTLALEDRTDAIARLLGMTRQEMIKMDGVLEKLSRNAAAMSSSIEDARRRTRVLGQKLRGLDAATSSDTDDNDDYVNTGAPDSDIFGRSANIQAEFNVDDEKNSSFIAS